MINELSKKYICECVRPYLEHYYVDGVHTITENKLTEQLIYKYFRSIRYPAHDNLEGEINCNQPDSSKRKDFEEFNMLIKLYNLVHEKFCEDDQKVFVESELIHGTELCKYIVDKIKSLKMRCSEHKG
jgi:hypothetical protein